MNSFVQKLQVSNDVTPLNGGNADFQQSQERGGNKSECFGLNLYF